MNNTQDVLDEMANWYLKWKIAINGKKSKVLIIQYLNGSERPPLDQLQQQIMGERSKIPGGHYRLSPANHATF